MKIFDVTTEKWAEFENYKEFAKFAGISETSAFCFFKENLSCLNKLVKECDVNKVFILKNIESNMEFKCINAMTMGLYLNCKLTRNELAQISNLKNDKVFLITIRKQKFFKIGGNKNKVTDRNRFFREKHKESRKIAGKLWREKNKKYTTEKIKDWKIKNNLKVTEYNRVYTKNRRKTDLEFKLRQNVRNRIRMALKNNSKFSSSEELIGCSIIELRNYLESKFIQGMTWENQGEWHIDHIVPCCNFDLSKIEDQKKCFHYTNLQPLWAIDNLKKGSK